MTTRKSFNRLRYMLKVALLIGILVGYKKLKNEQEQLTTTPYTNSQEASTVKKITATTPLEK